MNTPTAANLRDWAPPDFSWDSLGWPAPVGGAPDKLAKWVEWAVAYVENTTGRPLGTIDHPATPAQQDLVPIAEQAVMLATLQMVAQRSKRYVGVTVLQDYIQSFSAGSYSEQRRSPDEVLRRGGSISNPLVNQWRPLSDLLYLLMTPDMESYWRWRTGGPPMPASAFIGQDWGSGHEMRPAIWGPGIESWPVGRGW